MVVVAAPAAVVAALFALLFMLAWAQWGGAITNSLNVDIPIIGRVIGNAISYALNATYAALVYWLDAAVQPISSLILGPIAAVENTMTGLTTIAGQTYNAIYTIRNVHIPNVLTYAATVANQVVHVHVLIVAGQQVPQCPFQLLYPGG